MNREEMLEKIFAQLETLSREQLEELNLFIDAVKAEYQAQQAQEPAQAE